MIVEISCSDMGRDGFKQGNHIVINEAIEVEHSVTPHKTCFWTAAKTPHYTASVNMNATQVSDLYGSTETGKVSSVGGCGHDCVQGVNDYAKECVV